MATVDLITTAGRELEQQTNDLLNLVRVCSSINEQHPDWLDMFFPRIVDLDVKVQAYMMAVHQQISIAKNFDDSTLLTIHVSRET